LFLDGGNRAGHHQGQIHTFQRTAADGWSDAFEEKEKEQRREKFSFQQVCRRERGSCLNFPTPALFITNRPITVPEFEIPPFFQTDEFEHSGPFVSDMNERKRRSEGNFSLFSLMVWRNHFVVPSWFCVVTRWFESLVRSSERATTRTSMGGGGSWSGVSLFLKKWPRRDEGDRAYNILQLERTSNLQHAHITPFSFSSPPSVRRGGAIFNFVSYHLSRKGKEENKSFTPAHLYVIS
jgi:hypothetical protein